MEQQVSALEIERAEFTTVTEDLSAAAAEDIEVREVEIERLKAEIDILKNDLKQSSDCLRYEVSCIIIHINDDINMCNITAEMPIILQCGRNKQSLMN